MFKKKFIGELYMEAHKWEFINLVQGDMSIYEYKATFVWLNQYVVEMVSLGRDHCKRFCFGLHHDIQLYLVAHDISNCDEFMDKTKAVEEIRIVAPWNVIGLQTSW